MTNYEHDTTVFATEIDCCLNDICVSKEDITYIFRNLCAISNALDKLEAMGSTGTQTDLIRSMLLAVIGKVYSIPIDDNMERKAEISAAESQIEGNTQ